MVNRAFGFDNGRLTLPDQSSVRRAKPFENGFTNFLFSTKHFAQMGGFAVPTAFELKTFRQGSQSAVSSNDFLVNFILAAEVTNIAVNPIESIIPRMNGRTYVIDWRGKSLDGKDVTVAYLATNQILSINSAQFMALANGNPSGRIGERPNRPSIARYLLIGIFLVVSSLFLRSVIEEMKNGQKSKVKEKQ